MCVTLLPALFVPSYRQHITSIMPPITISLSSHLKASGFSSISICTHFNRVHYHLLPMEQLCLLANLFSCMFSYCPPGVSHGSTMKQWVLPPHSNSCSLLVPGDPGASKSCPALVCWSAAVSTTSSCVVQGWITRASQQRRLSFFLFEPCCGFLQWENCWRPPGLVLFYHFTPLILMISFIINIKLSGLLQKLHIQSFNSCSK